MDRERRGGHSHCQKDGPRIPSERPEVELGTEQHEEGGHEEAFGEARQLDLEPLRLLESSQHQTGSEPGQQSGAAGLVRDQREADEQDQGNPELQRPATGARKVSHGECQRVRFETAAEEQRAGRGDDDQSVAGERGRDLARSDQRERHEQDGHRIRQRYPGDQQGDLRTEQAALLEDGECHRRRAAGEKHREQGQGSRWRNRRPDQGSGRRREQDHYRKSDRGRSRPRSQSRSAKLNLGACDEHQHRETERVEEAVGRGRRIDDVQPGASEHRPGHDLADDRGYQRAAPGRDQRAGQAGQNDDQERREHGPRHSTARRSGFARSDGCRNGRRETPNGQRAGGPAGR